MPGSELGWSKRPAQPGEATRRAADAQAEAFYAARTEGKSAVEAAVVATALAEEIQAEEVAATGQLETPAEERGEPEPPPLPNPAR